MAKDTLPMNVISDMVNNYRNHQLKSIENSTRFPMRFDAHSAWFSLEELKSFIATIENEVAKNPETPTENLGIRLYYAAYPEEAYPQETNFEFPKEYKNLHTLIGVPTTDIKGIHQDFDPADAKTYEGAKPTEQGLAITAKNHNQLGPPFPLTGDWF